MTSHVLEVDRLHFEDRDFAIPPGPSFSPSLSTMKDAGRNLSRRRDGTQAINSFDAQIAIGLLGVWLTAIGASISITSAQPQVMVPKFSAPQVGQFVSAGQAFAQNLLSSAAITVRSFEKSAAATVYAPPPVVVVRAQPDLEQEQVQQRQIALQQAAKLAQAQQVLAKPLSEDPKIANDVEIYAQRISDDPELLEAMQFNARVHNLDVSTVMALSAYEAGGRNDIKSTKSSAIGYTQLTRGQFINLIPVYAKDLADTLLRDYGDRFKDEARALQLVAKYVVHDRKGKAVVHSELYYKECGVHAPNFNKILEHLRKHAFVGPVMQLSSDVADVRTVEKRFPTTNRGIPKLSFARRLSMVNGLGFHNFESAMRMYNRGQSYKPVFGNVWDSLDTVSNNFRLYFGRHQPKLAITPATETLGDLIDRGFSIADRYQMAFRCYLDRQEAVKAIARVTSPAPPQPAPTSQPVRVANTARGSTGVKHSPLVLTRSFDY